MKTLQAWFDNFIHNPADHPHKRRSFRMWAGIFSLVLALFVFPDLSRAMGGFLMEVSGPELARPGDVVAYEVRYENLGWPLLQDVALVGRVPEHTTFLPDSSDCTLFGDVVTCHVGSLAYGEGGEVTVALRVDHNAPIDAVISGKLVAVGHEPGEKLTYLNSVCGETKVVIPALAVDKRTSADIVYAGDPVQYTYTVTNTGDAALTEVTLADDQKSPNQVCDPVPELAAGEAFTCTWTPALEADTFNVATVTGQDPWADPVTTTDSAFVDVIQRPAENGGGIITLDKTAHAGILYAGETAIYTYTVTNPSDDLVRDISLVDDLLGAIAGPFDLAAGESAVFTAPSVLTEDTTNTAVAQGRNLLGDPVRAEDSAFVNVIQPPQPGGEGIISLELIASATEVYAGQTVVYTYTVANPGEDPVRDISLVDDMLGAIAGPFDLAAGESAVFTASAILTEDTTNTAVAQGRNLLGDLVRAEDAVSVGVTAPDVSLSLTLTASADRVYRGDTLTLIYQVTNTGSDTAFEVTLTNGSETIAGPFELAAGAHATFEVSETVNEDTAFAATATGTDRLDKFLEATATAYVDTIQRPDPDGGGILTLAVTPSATNVEAGTLVTYTYEITNVSSDPVDHIVVTDDQFGVVAASGMVQPLDMYEGFTLQGGESRTLTLSIPLYQNTQNVATATGEDLLLTPVSAQDDAYVNVWTTGQNQYTVFLPIVLRNGQ